MYTYHILFNRLSKSNNGEKEAHRLDEILKDNNLVYHDLEEICNYEEFFDNIPLEDKIVISGGDGTLNCFVNNIDPCYIKQDILFFVSGSGNDFAHDVGVKKYSYPFDIKKYITNLPVTTVNGVQKRFFDSVSLGVDAYVCVEANRQKSNGRKNINYGIIALKSILFKYKFRDAVVVANGQEHHFKNVILAITNKGKSFGGGIKVAPTQDRNSGQLTLIVAHGLPPIKAVYLFANIFLGKHLRFKEYVSVFTGTDFSVKFSAPTPIQIDGETTLDVTEYSVTTKSKETV